MTTEQAKLATKKDSRRKKKATASEMKKGEGSKKRRSDAEPAPQDASPQTTTAAVVADAAAPAQQPKKPRTEVRREQQKVAKERRMQRPHADVIEALRPHWEIIRQKGAKKEDKGVAIGAAMELIQGCVVDLARKGDSSRMLQSIFTYAGVEERVRMAREFVCPDRELTDEHMLHLLKKMVGDCAKSREVIMKGMRGNISRFFKSRLHCTFLEHLYINLNATLKMQLLAEIYSTEYATLSAPQDVISVGALLERLPGKREIVLNNLRSIVPQLLSRKLLEFTVVQRIVLDYLQVEVPSKITEAVESFLEHIEPMLESTLGAHAVVRLVAAATAKDRKQLIKIVKAHVQSLVFSPAAAVVLMAILEFTDDTVLVGKAIVQELTPFLGDIVKDKIGSRLVLFMLAGRVVKNITGHYVGMLAECDSLAAATSKKDKAVRRAELLAYLLPAMKEQLDMQALQLVKSQFAYPAVIEHLEQADDKADILKSIVGEAGGVSQLMQDRTAEQFIRALVKRSESLAMALFDLVSPELGSHLQNGDATGYLFAVMLRHEPIRDALKLRLAEIEAVGTQAATFLAAKIRDGKSLAAQNEQ